MFITITTTNTLLRTIEHSIVLNNNFYDNNNNNNYYYYINNNSSCSSSSGRASKNDQTMVVKTSWTETESVVTPEPLQRSLQSVLLTTGEPAPPTPRRTRLATELAVGAPPPLIGRQALTLRRGRRLAAVWKLKLRNNRRLFYNNTDTRRGTIAPGGIWLWHSRGAGETRGERSPAWGGTGLVVSGRWHVFISCEGKTGLCCQSSTTTPEPAARCFLLVPLTSHPPPRMDSALCCPCRGDIDCVRFKRHVCLFLLLYSWACWGNTRAGRDGLFCNGGNKMSWADTSYIMFFLWEVDLCITWAPSHLERQCHVPMPQEPPLSSYTTYYCYYFSLRQHLHVQILWSHHDSFSLLPRCHYLYFVSCIL